MSNTTTTTKCVSQFRACACPLCEARRAAALAASHATVAIQAAAWRPRSKRLRIAAEEAVRDRGAALDALAALEAAR